MKKSEITVTMPINFYEELVSYKEKYFELSRKLSDCYDTALYKICSNEPVRFDEKKAEAIIRQFLPYDCRNASIIF